jgi:excisionase family DNA binding protein
MTDDRYMTSEEVAEYLRLDVQTVMRMAARGELPAAKIGRHWRFRKSYLDAHYDAELKKKQAQQAEKEPA